MLSGLSPDDPGLVSLLEDIATGAVRVEENSRAVRNLNEEWGSTAEPDGWEDAPRWGDDNFPPPVPSGVIVDNMDNVANAHDNHDFERNEESSSDSDDELIGLVNLEGAVGGQQHRIFQDPALAILDLFKCVLCEGLIYPQYLQCKKFHVVCENCLSRIDDGCPFCRGRKPYKKNHRLEAFAESIKFVCKNRDKGCNLTLSGEDWNSHVDSCSYNNSARFVEID